MRSNISSSGAIALVVIIPIAFVAIWSCTGYLVALTGGWRLLAKRFRMEGEFAGLTRKMQGARMRYSTNYNNALTIGADQNGLFMAPFVLFRVGHPPLFIPWAEISNVRPVTVLFFFQFVAMQLGQQEQIPFMIRTSLAEWLKTLAGTSWPQGNRNWNLPPPPIG